MTDADLKTREQETLTFITQWLSEQLKRDVAPDAHFATLGLDSLDAVRLVDAVAEKFGVDELPVSLVLEHPVLSELAVQLTAAAKK
jgi:acyl carrier protein